MAASVSQDGRFRAVFLSVIMVLMTQVGYTENMDFSLSFDEENELLETGGSTSNSTSNNLSPSRDNVVATVGEPMAEISWYHDVSPSGGNAGTTTQGNGSAWLVNEDKYIHYTNYVKPSNIGATIGDTFYYVATAGDIQDTNRVIYSYNKTSGTVGDVGTFGTMPTYTTSGYSNTRAFDLFTNVGDVLLFDGYGMENITAYNTATDSSYSIGVSYSGNEKGSNGIGTSILIGDTLYFSGTDYTTTGIGAELYAYNAGNNTTWLAADISLPGVTLPQFHSSVGWQDIAKYGGSNPGHHHGFRLIGNTIYFDASTGFQSNNNTYAVGASGVELFAYSLSNMTSWQVTDIDNRAPTQTITSTSSTWLDGFSLEATCYSSSTNSICDENTMTVVGDTLFFGAQDSNGEKELWAHNTSNHTTWQVANINTMPSTRPDFCKQSLTLTTADSWPYTDISVYNSSTPKGFYTVGDTAYFTASNGFYSRELWAYDTSNNSVWQVTRFYRCDDLSNSYWSGFQPEKFDGENNFNVIGDKLLFYRDGGLYIHDDTTQHTKRLWTPNKHHQDVITEWRSNGPVVLGDTLYGIQLFLSQPFGNNPPTDNPVGGYVTEGTYLYAYDTSNETLYRTGFVSSPTSQSSHDVEQTMVIASGDTIFFGGEYYSETNLYAYQPAEVSYPRERVSEAVCTISPTLPAGLNFDSNQCTISGTPTAPTSQASYTVNAIINNTTYQGNVLLATSYYPIEPSVSGIDARIGNPIDDISFQIDPMVGISSSSGGNSGSSGKDYSNPIECTFSGNSLNHIPYDRCRYRQWYGSDYRSDYGAGLSFDWSSIEYGEAIATNPTILPYGFESLDTAVDSNGHVHIVYLLERYYPASKILTYATNQSGSWQSFAIEENASGMASIAIDSNDSVHIAYSALDITTSNYPELKHATNENGSWVISIVSSSYTTSRDIAIDSQDNLHIAFSNYYSGASAQRGSVQIANNTDGSWTVSTVYTNSTYASSSSYSLGRHAVLAIDSNDSLHLSWGVEIDGDMVIHYSSNQSGTWSDTVVDRYDSVNDLASDSILLDSNDNVHLLHHKNRVGIPSHIQAQQHTIHKKMVLGLTQQHITQSVPRRRGRKM